jgi:hypothetical protein
MSFGEVIHVIAVLMTKISLKTYKSIRKYRKLNRKEWTIHTEENQMTNEDLMSYSSEIVVR